MTTLTGTKTAQISCINKSDRPNPHERITHIGGESNGGWKLTQQQAIDMIDRGEWSFYTHVNGRSVWVVVAISPWGHRYLRTEADGQYENNLLSLPECF